ncbi:hypothetical protein B0H11DRAFT_1937033 [Mycena galericulata]|nr:hypothetical protein B0H11DRAFT_1937033 [Mycena galericulata]
MFKSPRAFNFFFLAAIMATVIASPAAEVNVRIPKHLWTLSPRTVAMTTLVAVTRMAVQESLPIQPPFTEPALRERTMAAYATSVVTLMDPATTMAALALAVFALKGNSRDAHAMSEDSQYSATQVAAGVGMSFWGQ